MIFGDEANVRARAILILQLAANGLGLGIVHRMILSEIPAVTATINQMGCDTGAEIAIFAQRGVYCAFKLEMIVIAHGEICVAADFACGRAADDVQRAACGISAVKHRLRAAQYFDAFDVEER